MPTLVKMVYEMANRLNLSIYLELENQLRTRSGRTGRGLRWKTWKLVEMRKRQRITRITLMVWNLKSLRSIWLRSGMPWEMIKLVWARKWIGRNRACNLFMKEYPIEMGRTPNKPKLPPFKTEALHQPSKSTKNPKHHPNKQLHQNQNTQKPQTPAQSPRVQSQESTKA